MPCEDFLYVFKAALTGPHAPPSRHAAASRWRSRRTAKSTAGRLARTRGRAAGDRTES